MRRLSLILAAAALGACGTDRGDVFVPPTAPSLDQQVRQIIAGWGVVPIVAIKAQDPALVDLGRSLFFDKILSGNRDVACSTCHSPLASTGDGLSLAVGTGWTAAGSSRALGKGRRFTPRNAPSLFNAALGAQYMFWDGRVSIDFGQQGFHAPTGVTLPSGLSNLLAVQAMIPVTNRVEMRGDAGDRDVLGDENELALIADDKNQAIWDSVMRRVLGIPAYVQKFNAAFPNIATGQLGFQHAANAIAAFEASTFTKTNTSFDQYLNRDDNAISADAKRGALLFFGNGRCSTCHNGPMLGAQQFANAGVPQLGPGSGKQLPLDDGRQNDGSSGPIVQAFSFRVAPLRNVELSAPYMHDGVYSTLEEVVRHYNNVDSALKSFDPSTLATAFRASYHGDGASINAISSTIDARVRQPLRLSADEQSQIVAFLKSLTDPSAREMSSAIPGSVPSGLSVPR